MPQSYTCAIGYISARIHKCHMVAKVPKRIQRCHLKVTNVPIDLARSLSLSLSLFCFFWGGGGGGSFVICHL